MTSRQRCPDIGLCLLVRRAAVTFPMALIWTSKHSIVFPLRGRRLCHQPGIAHYHSSGLVQSIPYSDRKDMLTHLTHITGLHPEEVFNEAIECSQDIRSSRPPTAEPRLMGFCCPLREMTFRELAIASPHEDDVHT